MLHIHHSNRAERLLDGLAALVSRPLADPLAPETVVVQNPGMARWLAQQLALKAGIAANLDFPLPASFVWRIQAAWLARMPDDEGGYDRESLQWRILALLPGFLPDPRFAELQRYLKEDESGLKAWQLAGRIADVFDQYLVYRPDMVLGWEAGREHHWQAVLWRSVVEKAGNVHRAGLFAAFRQAVEAGAEPIAVLPERVSLFGLTALAPVHLHAFAALARHADVHLFLLNPSAEYWTDIVDERGQARRRALWRRRGGKDFSGLLDVGNPLLAAFGHTGQGFLDQLLDLNASDEEAFQDPGEETLLAAVQHDILHLTDRRGSEDHSLLSDDDRSVQIHACHTPMREVQTLHDRLLSLFEALPDLRPRQIVVMAPDIDVYAPHVEAVFGAAPASRHIPWTVADRPVQSEAPVVETLIELLDLPVRRLSASEVLGLLEVQAVSRRFGLKADSSDRIRTWVAESGIRWGADAAMRAAEDLPAEPANTWAAGMARLFLGYALPPTESFFGDTLSHPDVEGAEACDLGALQTLVDRLAHWHGKLARPARAADWLGRINALIGDFMAPTAEEDETLQTVRRISAAMGEQAGAAGLDALLTARVVKAHIQAHLAAAGGARRFLLGGVTFCNMVPMRAIPFRVVCLLGLNDTDFPRRQHPPSFDRIAADPRPGDRSRRLDDRYLFLEALLSARDVLYLSYLGADVRDNSPRMPSLVVGELIDYIDRGLCLADGGRPSTRLVCRHPLQPFSARLFDGRHPDLFSYDQRWLAAAQQTATDERQPFVGAALPFPDDRLRTVDIEDVAGFFRHPARWFLHQRLGIRLEDAQAPPEDQEPFDLDGLQRYGVGGELAADLLAGRPADNAARRMRGRGWLPHGAPGEAVWSEVAAEMEDFVRRVRMARGAPAAELELDLPLGPFRLRGWLKDLTASGRLAFRPATIKAADRLRLWIHHLALCVAAPANVALESTYIGSDRVLRLSPVAEAAGRLEALLSLWWQGQATPLPFFPETSLAYAAARHKGQDEARAFEACQKAWLDEYTGRGEALDPSVELAWRGRQPLENAFATIALQVFDPLLEAANEEKPA